MEVDGKQNCLITTIISSFMYESKS